MAFGKASLFFAFVTRFTHQRLNEKLDGHGKNKHQPGVLKTYGKAKGDKETYRKDPDRPGKKAESFPIGRVLPMFRSLTSYSIF
jgi:hypothetical protein